MGLTLEFYSGNDKKIIKGVSDGKWVLLAPFNIFVDDSFLGKFKIYGMINTNAKSLSSYIFVHEMRGRAFCTMLNFDCGEVMLWNGLRG